MHFQAAWEASNLWVDDGRVRSLCGEEEEEAGSKRVMAPIPLHHPLSQAGRSHAFFRGSANDLFSLCPKRGLKTLELSQDE